MAKFTVMIDVCASMHLDVEATTFEEAERKAQAEIFDEDLFFDAHKDELTFWNPTIEEIVKEDSE